MGAAWDWNIGVKQEISSWIGGFVEEEIKKCLKSIVSWVPWYGLHTSSWAGELPEPRIY